MAKHPAENANVNFDDDQQAHVTVNIIDTSVSNNARSQIDFETHDVMETFDSGTGVHEYFQSQHSTAGGPPGVLSIFDGAVSVLSRVTRASVMNDMTSLFPESDP